jgi:hypothetical protein
VAAKAAARTVATTKTAAIKGILIRLVKLKTTPPGALERPYVTFVRSISKFDEKRKLVKKV